MYRRHTMETVQYQDRTTATSNLWLTQIKIRGKHTSVLQTFFGCGNDGPVKVIWLHECSEGLKFSEVLRSLSVQVWGLSARQMLRCAWWKNISCGRSPSTRHRTFHLHARGFDDNSHRSTMHDFCTSVVCTKVSVLLMVLCISEPKPGVNPWSQMWIKVWKSSTRDRNIWF